MAVDLWNVFDGSELSLGTKAWPPHLRFPGGLVGADDGAADGEMVV